MSPGNLVRRAAAPALHIHKPTHTEQLAVPYKQLVCESHSHGSMSQRSSRREQNLAKARGWEVGDVSEVGTRHLSGDAVPAALSASVYGHASFPACPTGAEAGLCLQRQLS